PGFLGILAAPTHPSRKDRAALPAIRRQKKRPPGERQTTPISPAGALLGPSRAPDGRSLPQALAAGERTGPLRFGLPGRSATGSGEGSSPPSGHTPSPR